MLTVKFEFLADRPEIIDVVAGWYYAQWGHLNPEATAAAIATTISQSMNKDRLPILLLAFVDNAVVGAVELKFREMDIYPDREHWLGGVFVRSEYRGLGIGKRLVSEAIQLAQKFAVQTLYLQTEELSGGIYAELGWQRLEKVRYKSTTVLVMERRVHL